MLDWDYDYNDKGLGIITTYTPNYDIGSERIYSFGIKDLDFFLKQISIIYGGWEHADNEDDFLIGLNSNSFTMGYGKHNLFLEWDEKDKKPDLEHLKRLRGVISRTKNGLHFIREDNLSIDELLTEQKKWGCCQGFIKSTKDKKHSCLRVSPKQENNNIRIIDYNDSFLHNIYKDFVEKLGGTCEFNR